MSNDREEPSIAQQIQRGTLKPMNAEALADARRIAGYKPSASLKQSSGLVGEQAARDWVRREYRGRAREIAVPRRGGATPVLDLVFETGPGEYVVIEAKGNIGPEEKEVRLGTSKRKSIRTTPQGFQPYSDRKGLTQFRDPEWFELKLKELKKDFGPEGDALAKRLNRSWRAGKLRPIIVHAPLTGLTAEHIRAPEDLSSRWNAHVQAENRHKLPSYNTKFVPITDPARLIGPSPTNVERGVEAAEKAILPSEPPVPRPRLSTAEHLGEGALKIAQRGFKARSLVIGVKAWRAARTVGKILVMCFVPLKVFDVVLEIAFALWDREREKDERKRKEKQRALEAVFEADKHSQVLQKAVQSNIVENAKVQEAFLSSWDDNKNYNGFQYARLHATLAIEAYRNLVNREESESLTSYRLIRLTVLATSSQHDFELEDIGEEKTVDKTDEDKIRLVGKAGLDALYLDKITKTKKLSYTLVPPLLTPYDIVVTKINNLFLDIVFFCAQFSNSGDSVLKSFGGFNYTYRWDEQFTPALEFPHPLNPPVCQYCLAYLHSSAKHLSRHPLEQQDLEGNLENTQKGWKRRFWLLMSLLEGENTQHGKNFSFFAAQIKGLVKRGEKNDEIVAAIEQIYTGARAILYDLERIERNLRKPEYYYLGPQYKPSK